MRHINRFWLISLAFLFIIFTCSWGFLVHRTAHQLAVYELPNAMQPFFHANMAYLVKNAPRPDLRRNEDSTEATKHFIDLEAFGENAAYNMPFSWEEAIKLYSADTLYKYGHVPYVIIDLKNRLTNAFRNEQADSILFYAADIGHYIGDANVPLHTTINYDGQLTNQKGLHSLWESMIPELLLNEYKLSSKHRATYLRNPEEAIWKAIRRANALVAEMLLKEIEVSKQFTDSTKFRVQIRRGKEVKSYTTAFAKAYAASLKKSINEQLIYSADLIADFWYTAWVDAGKPDTEYLMKNNSTSFNKAQFDAEKKSFKKNTLLKNGFLLAKANQSVGE